MDLAQVVTHKGIGYVAYHRLDIHAVSDDLAKLVTRVAGFDEESDYFMIIRSLVGEWRAKSYREHGAGKPSLNQFLFEFNLNYPMRRINFLRTKISELAEKCRSDPEAQNKLLAIKKVLNQAYKDLRGTARKLRFATAPSTAHRANHPRRGFIRQRISISMTVKNRLSARNGTATSASPAPRSMMRRCATWYQRNGSK